MLLSQTCVDSFGYISFAFTGLLKKKAASHAGKKWKRHFGMIPEVKLELKPVSGNSSDGATGAIATAESPFLTAIPLFGRKRDKIVWSSTRPLSFISMMQISFKIWRGMCCKCLRRVREEETIHHCPYPEVVGHHPADLPGREDRKQGFDELLLVIDK